MIGPSKHKISGVAARRRIPPRSELAREGKFLFTTLLQSMLCVMMITAAFVTSGIFGMAEVKTAFFALITKETEAVEVFSVVQKVAQSEKISRLRSIIDLILNQAGTSPRITVSQPDGQGGQLLFQPETEMALPEGVTDLSPILSAPMKLPVQGVLSSPFGVRKHPITGKPDFHTGVDFAAPLKSSIGAAWPGVVVETGESQIYGHFITLDHGGFKTRYCHCYLITAKVGMKIRQGETIALVGNTGISTGPHLHFELILNGKTANPLAECMRWQSL